MDEYDLISRLNLRQRSALEQAIHQFTPYVNAVLYRTLSGYACREDMEELSADVFLSLWTHAEDLNPNQNIRPWLTVVARNKATDWLRTHHPPDGPIPDDTPDPSDGPELLSEHRERSAQLWSAVHSLPEPDRTLFIRYYYDNIKLKQAAQELGISPNTAKQRLFRGRKTLKSILTKGEPSL